MIKVVYNHPLHGTQHLKCKELVFKHEEMHVVNIHGVTFQTIEPNRIQQVHAMEEEK